MIQHPFLLIIISTILSLLTPAVFNIKLSTGNKNIMNVMIKIKKSADPDSG